MDKMERRWRKIDEQASCGEVDFAGIVGKLTHEQMMNALDQLITDECYELVPAQPIGSATPDFHAMLQGKSVHTRLSARCACRRTRFCLGTTSLSRWKRCLAT